MVINESEEEGRQRSSHWSLRCHIKEVILYLKANGGPVRSFKQERFINLKYHLE